MPAQEGELDLDGLLVAVKEGLVVPARQPDELSPRGVPRGAGRGPGKRAAIVVAGEDQERTPHAGRGAPRAIEAEAQRGAGRDLLPPVGGLVLGVERSGTIDAVGRGEGGDRSAR